MLLASNTFSSLSSQDSAGRELLFFNNDPIMKTVFGVERNIEDINFPSSEEIDGLESVLPDGIVHGWFDSTFENKQLHRRKWEASNPQAIVIFMHGISTHSAKYVQSSSSSNETSPPRLISATLMVDTFLQNNISVYAYDQYGHGYSEGVRFLIPESYTVNVEDYINFCQLVATENTLGKPIFLMCESYGCTVQLHAAKYFQDQAATENQLPDLDSMILTAPAITMAPASQPIAQTVAFSVLIFLSIFFPEWRPFFVPNFATPETVWRDPLVRAFYTNSTNPATIVDGSGLQYRLGTARQLLRAITNVGETIIPMLATPFITIHGTGDAVTPISGSEFLFENSLTPSDSKEIIKVDGAYHDLLADPAAEICMDGIMQWINQRVALLPVS